MTVLSEGPILETRDLYLEYRSRGRVVYALQGASLLVRPSEIVGIVGESGSGKSTIARAALGLLPWESASITGGQLLVDGIDFTRLPPANWEQLRGNPVAIVFQDPLSFLNPVMRVDAQIAEGIRKHDRAANPGTRVLELLELVRLPANTAHFYPHELSGGMRQRVLLAIALACRPRLLIADEPTTALDVTTQAEIMALLREIKRTLDVSILIISHNLAVVADLCDRIYVMYGGRMIEAGPSTVVLTAPGHPYTYGLMRAASDVRDSSGRFATIQGDVPSLNKIFPGCPFVARCPVAIQRCSERKPPHVVVESRSDHTAACWLTEQQGEELHD